MKVFKFKKFLNVFFILLFSFYSFKSFANYFSDYQSYVLKNEQNEIKGSYLPIVNFHCNSKIDEINFFNNRYFGFDGVDILKIDIHYKNSKDIKCSVKSARRNDKNCFDVSFDDKLFQNRFNSSNSGFENSMYDIYYYDDKTGSLLASEKDVFLNYKDTHERKYGRCYTMNGEATSALVQVDGTGLHGALFPEQSNIVNGVDCSDISKQSGLRGQTHVKLKYYDVFDGNKFVAEKIAELKYFKNNDNIQFDMHNEEGHPMVCNGKDYKVKICDMNDKPLCWFRYIVGKNIEQQNW